MYYIDQGCATSKHSEAALYLWYLSQSPILGLRMYCLHLPNISIFSAMIGSTKHKYMDSNWIHKVVPVLN
jgi:hypothetical protein